MSDLTRPVIERLPRYYHYLCELARRDNGDTVLSGQLAEMAGVDDTLVRHDLGAIGVRGQPKVGYPAAEALAAIRKTLGFDRKTRAVLVGAGRLGGALASYRGFAELGLEIVAVFDADPDRIGKSLSGREIRNIETLGDRPGDGDADFAILAIPADAAQATAERILAAGIRAIWNFAPVALEAPDDTIIRNEMLCVGLAEICYRLRQGE